MRKLILLILIVFVFAGCGREDATTGLGIEEKGMSGPLLAPLPAAAPTTGEALMAADFNSAGKPSNIGGDFGAWDKDPADFSQTCTDSFDPVNKFGQSGFGMKLDYDVDSPNPAYNGFWMKLNNLDVSAYKNLVFCVKGDEEAGFTTVFKVELKSANGEVGKFYATGTDIEWKKMSIPLKQFAGISSFSELAEFVIVFEDRMATNKDGVIYIDDIQFTR